MRVKDPAKTMLIHQSALKLVVQNGMDGLRMADIAKDANIATGTLYVYFQDKETLLSAIFETANSNYIQHLPKEKNGHQPFRTTFKNAFTGALLYWVNNYAEAMFIEQYRYSSFLSEEEKAKPVPAESYFEQLLTGAKKQLLVKSMDTGLMRCAITGLLQQTAVFCIRNQQPLTKPFIEKVFTLCWDAIKV